MWLNGAKSFTHECRVVMTLDDFKGVTRNVLATDVPRFAGAANIESLTLAQCVKPQAIVLTNEGTFRCFNTTRFIWEVTRKKVFETPFANKADTRTVFSFAVWQSKVTRTLAAALSTRLTSK